ncbi:MAG TPA: substrate-binding domain-containing protein [Beijerinckiaceae bacterium]|jgi:tungstate transport system substrate-binding protein
MRRAIACALLILAAAQPASAQPAPTQTRAVQVGSTTSVEDSGLMADLTPRFRAATGLSIDLTAKSSAETLVLARRGLYDVVIVNNPEAAEAFVAAGDGLPARALMSDTFIIVGPAEDPAGVRQAPDFPSALVAIARERAPFVSRGDNSGTHSAEMKIWASAGVDPKKRSGSWYRETGLGMADALQVAARLKAYAFVDRATWLASGVATTLPALQVRNPPLNRFVAVPVNPARYPSIQANEARRFLDWLTSPEGQDAIGRYTVGGERPFVPATRSGS